MQAPMRTLVYRRTHPHDPDERGCFGVEDCMGGVRAWEFDAVIGIGGNGVEAQSHNINGNVHWIGVDARRHNAPRQPGAGCQTLRPPETEAGEGQMMSLPRTLLWSRRQRS